MANDTVITVIGNLTTDPEVRFTPSGSAVANFTIASTPRTFDKQSNQWKDGEALFLRSAVWREAAENVTESLTKGTRVIAQGRLRSRSYDTKEGERRTVMELEVDEIGPSLAFASAKVTRTQRNGNGGGNRAPQPQQSPQQSAPQQSRPQQGGGWNAPAADPWSTGNNQPQGNGGGWGNPQQSAIDEPPF